MKKIMKKGVIIISVYLIAVLCTLLVSNRIQELDANSNFRNTNQSLSINFSR